MSPNLFLFVTLIAISTLIKAAPYIERRDIATCQSGTFRDIAPYLRRYPPAAAFCNAAFPPKCTANQNSARSAQSATPENLITISRRASSTTPVQDARASVFSQIRKQPYQVLAAFCSCIQTQKPCPTRTKQTTTTTTSATSSSTTTSLIPSTTCPGFTIQINGGSYNNQYLITNGNFIGYTTTASSASKYLISGSRVIDKSSPPKYWQKANIGVVIRITDEAHQLPASVPVACSVSNPSASNNDIGMVTCNDNQGRPSKFQTCPQFPGRLVFSTELVYESCEFITLSANGPCSA